MFMEKMQKRIYAILLILLINISVLPHVYGISTEDIGEVNYTSHLDLNESEKDAISLLALNCGLSDQKLKSLLLFEAWNKACSLVPVCNLDEHKQCFLRVFSYADADYMKYYASGLLMKPDYVKGWFSRSVNITNQKFPRAITFLIKVEDNVVGRIGLGPLRERKKIDAEIGYAIEKPYSGKGIMGKAVTAALSFLSYLRKSGNSGYNFKRLRATARLDNKGSNHILSSHGFVLSKTLSRESVSSNEYFYYFK